MSRNGGAFLAHVLETLAPLGGVTGRRMFGGAGIFKDGLMFALIADDVLYLKVDDGNRAAYDAAGLQPFVYQARGRATTLSYREAPDEGLEDPEQLLPWAEAAFAAARRAAAAGPPRRRKGA